MTTTKERSLSVDNSSEKSTPETEEVHQSKKQKVSFEEVNSGTVQMPAKSKSKEKNNAELLSDDGDITKKKKKQKHNDIDEKTGKKHRDKSGTTDSLTTPAEPSISTHISARDEVSTSGTQNSNNAKKRPRANSSVLTIDDPVMSSIKTVTATGNPEEQERVMKKPKKKVPDSVGDKEPLPSTSRPIQTPIEPPRPVVVAAENAQVPIKKKKSSSNIKEAAHSGVASVPPVDVQKDDPSSKKAKKAVDSVPEKGSSSKPISKKIVTTEKPKSTTSSTVPNASTSSAVAIPDKGTTVKPKKRQVDAKEPAPSKEKPEASSGSKGAFPISAFLKLINASIRYPSSRRQEGVAYCFW